MTKVRMYFTKRILLLYCFLTAAAVLLFCSRSSPLYPMNDWEDVHCFLTLGRGILGGMVPYVDLYEQKGPILYFVYAVVALFSQKSMFGQYVLEVITTGLFLYYSAKITEIYLGKTKYLYPIVAAIAAITSTSLSFDCGGSVEQMCLFMFVYGLYSAIRANCERRGLSFRDALINGIFAGITLWIKYTMLGFYLGLAMFVIIWYVKWRKDIKGLLSVIGQFLLGVAVITSIVCGYFLSVGGFKALYICYFYNNIFLYSAGKSGLLVMLGNFFWSLLCNPGICFLIILGGAWLVFDKKKNFFNLVAVGFSFAGMALCTSMGKGYPYYAHVYSAFVVLGFIPIILLLRYIKFSEFVSKICGTRSIVVTTLSCVFLAAMVWLSFYSSPNTYLLSYEKEDLPQYKFANIINETKNPTLLNFGFLDGGFYYAADVLPSCRYFCFFNVNTEEMWQTQYECVRDGKVDYIITRHFPLEEYGADSSRYELIETAEYNRDGEMVMHYLYKLKADDILTNSAGIPTRVSSSVVEPRLQRTSSFFDEITNSAHRKSAELLGA